MNKKSPYMTSINYERKYKTILRDKNENNFKMKCIIKICFELQITYRKIIQKKRIGTKSQLKQKLNI